ncbi:hypothetical protein BJX64DRAFT_84019 [Aspergillus heterothallicus]
MELYCTHLEKDIQTTTARETRQKTGTETTATTATASALLIRVIPRLLRRIPLLWRVVHGLLALRRVSLRRRGLVAAVPLLGRRVVDWGWVGGRWAVLACCRTFWWLRGVRGREGKKKNGKRLLSRDASATTFFISSARFLVVARLWSAASWIPDLAPWIVLGSGHSKARKRGHSTTHEYFLPCKSYSRDYRDHAALTTQSGCSTGFSSRSFQSRRVFSFAQPLQLIGTSSTTEGNGEPPTLDSFSIHPLLRISLMLISHASFTRSLVVCFGSEYRHVLDDSASCFPTQFRYVQFASRSNSCCPKKGKREEEMTEGRPKNKTNYKWEI